MRNEGVCLSIVIPTYNRSRYLRSLLDSLTAQICEVPAGEVQIIVSDNGSTDQTASIIAGFQETGFDILYSRNESNLGPDANILHSYQLASGEYVWVIGDDDLIVPGTLREVLSLLKQCPCDVAYISSFSFHGDYVAGKTDRGKVDDTFGRYAEVVTDGAYFLSKTGALFGLLSGNITNKRRLGRLTCPPLESLQGTFLVQLGWQMPLIHRKMTVLYVWRKLVAYRTFNSEGWSAPRVFGLTLDDIAARYFAEEPALRRILMNSVLRYWMPDVILGMRSGKHPGLETEGFVKVMEERYRENWRYWLFVYALAETPLPFARLLHHVLSLGNKATRLSGTLWRCYVSHGKYLQP